MLKGWNLKEDSKCQKLPHSCVQWLNVKIDTILLLKIVGKADGYTTFVNLTGLYL